MQSEAEDDPRTPGILRRLLAARERKGVGLAEAAVVAVTSGKGGTGKSFVGSNLAVLLSGSRRATLVDCDYGLGNAHLLLGLNPGRTLQHWFANQARVEELPHASRWGPDLVAAGSGVSGMAALTDRDLLRLGEALGWLARDRDVLVLDTAAGISPQLLLTLSVADHVVVITNPEIAALTDAYATIKCLARRGSSPPVSVVVNRVPVVGSGRSTFDKLAEVTQRFCGCSLHYLGEIPEDMTVTQRRLGQPPIVVADADSDTSRCLRRIHEELERLTPLLPRPRRRLLLDRLRACMAPLVV